MLRNERFSRQFLNQVEALLQVLTPYLASKHKEMPHETQQLNLSIANFLKVNFYLFIPIQFIFGNIAFYAKHFEIKTLLQL